MNGVRRLPMGMAVTVAFISAAVAMVNSQQLVKIITGYTSNFMVSQTAVLAVFIGSMGLGSYLSDLVVREKIGAYLARIQVAMGLASLAMLPAVNVVYVILKFYFLRVGSPEFREDTEFAAAFLLIAAQPLNVVVGVAAGLELSLLLRYLDSGRQTSIVLAANYAGSACATFVFIWILPVFSAFSLSISLAAVNVILALLLAAYFFRARPRAWLIHLCGTAAVAFLLTVSSIYGRELEQFFLRVQMTKGLQVFRLKDIPRMINGWILKMPEVLEVNTGYQKAQFSVYGDGGFTFWLDSHSQLDFSWVDQYHDSLIHLPIQIMGQVPKRVLVLGGGDGIAVDEILKYKDQVEDIDLVELDPWMVRAATKHQFFTDLNGGSMSDPRLRLHVGDAMVFLRKTSRKFDAVFLDFPLPYEADLTKLYSVEFYRLIRRHLAPKGFIAFDAPAGCGRTGPLARGKGEWPSRLLNTLEAAGFGSILRYCTTEGFIVARSEKNDDFPLAKPSRLKDFGVSYKVLSPAFLQITEVQPNDLVRAPGVISLFQFMEPKKSVKF